MTDYTFSKEQHSTKIKAGLLKAKQAGKKLGRPQSEKIKGEDEARDLYLYGIILDDRRHVFLTVQEVAERVGISKSTVQKIINKYKKDNG